MPRSGPGSAGNGSPSSSTAPCDGRSWPRISRRKVLLPAPEGPTTERKVPDAISMLMRSSTICDPYSTQTLRKDKALISAAPDIGPGESLAREQAEQEVEYEGQ